MRNRIPLGQFCCGSIVVYFDVKSIKLINLPLPLPVYDLFVSAQFHFRGHAARNKLQTLWLRPVLARETVLESERLRDST